MWSPKSINPFTSLPSCSLFCPKCKHFLSGRLQSSTCQVQAWRTRRKSRLSSLRRRVQERKIALVTESWRSRERLALVASSFQSIQVSRASIRMLRFQRWASVCAYESPLVVHCVLCVLQMKILESQSPYCPVSGSVVQWCLDSSLCRFWLQSLDIRSPLSMLHSLHLDCWTAFLCRKDFTWLTSWVLLAVALVVKYWWKCWVPYLLSLETLLWMRISFFYKLEIPASVGFGHKLTCFLFV